MATLAAAPAIAPGTACTIVGLQSRADLNGRAATVLRWLDDAERYVLLLSGGGEKVSLRARNLNLVDVGAPSTPTAPSAGSVGTGEDRAAPAAGAVCSIAGLVSRADLNGERWYVSLRSCVCCLHRMCVSLQLFNAY